MSGANPQGSGIPNPIAIPFPLIPLNGQGTMGQPAGPKKKKKKNKNSKNVSRKESESGKVFLNTKSNDKTLGDQQKLKKKQSGNRRQKRGIGDSDEYDTVTIEELKDIADRSKRSLSDDYELTEEETIARDEWLSPDDHIKVTGKEGASFLPEDLVFIAAGQSQLMHAINNVMPDMRRKTVKRGTYEDNDLFLNKESSKRNKRSSGDYQSNINEDSNEDEKLFARDLIPGEELSEDIDDALYGILHDSDPDDPEERYVFTRDLPDGKWNYR